ncbi:MAG: hypothetical protein PHD33_03550 [Atribacterota bacterium]|nr:hypothetical protein [Atribacterota bacterium]
MSNKPQPTAGYYLKLAGKLQLASYGLAIASGAIYALGADNEVIFIAAGLACFGMSVGSQVCLIKAGKLMNNEQVYLSPASEGIGLAINF